MRNLTNKGSTILISIWAVAVVGIIVSSIQIFANRGTSLGQLGVEKVRARWAARAGLETTLGVLQEFTNEPVREDAIAMFRELERVAFESDYRGLSWNISSNQSDRDEPIAGPICEHSKLNINAQGVPQFWLGSALGESPLIWGASGRPQEIIDWLDDDDEPFEMMGITGAERDYYESLDTPYTPRNGTILTSIELELIGGIRPDIFRGEDWNLNGRLDPNENDQSVTFPYDNRNNRLEGGWSQIITAWSRDGGATETGLLRINLTNTSAEEVLIRLNEEFEVIPAITEVQAEALVSFGQQEQPLTTLLQQELTQLVANVEGLTNLEEDQLRGVLSEFSTFEPHLAPAGKMNINTVSPTILQNMFAEFGDIDDGARLVDAIMYERSRPGGISSEVDFDLGGALSSANESALQTLLDLFTVRSNVFTINCIGKSLVTNSEQEISITVDRSTLPIKILEYREP